MRFPTVALLLTFAAVTQALAVTPDEILQNPALEARARQLSQGLRCMVCQNQSIDDSDAPLAHDLRVMVRQRLQEGDTDKQVLQFLVDRYGDFVLLKPPFKPETLLLWALPPAVLLAGFAALIAAARRRRVSDSPPAPLTVGEQERLARLTESE
jgi:cytochrome c-type biogenesis protein CcmH